MIDKKMLDALNEQITQELTAAHHYLAMAAYFEDQTLPGFAKWMHAQSDEERGHAMRIFNYVYDRNGSVKLEAVPKPMSDFKSPLDVMQRALGHEQKVTASIHELFEMARAERDHPTEVMLHWFIQEQVEEENSIGQIVDKLQKVEDNPAGLLLLDQHLGERSG